MTTNEEFYTIIGLIISVLGIIAAYFVVPLIQAWFAPTPNPTSRPTGSPPPWVPELVKVPVGAFLMGSTDDYALDDEKPQHTLILPDYWIGRTEVTNAQFRPFVEGDGYTNTAYWTNEGWAWRIVEEISEPEYWEDSCFNGDDQPVVGVSWYEAVAYVRWLSAQTGHEFHLPSEAEWEKAARGSDGRIYPWGDTWDANRLNSGKTVGKTTPVGQYPNGASPYGALDMAGNVSEWCATQYGKGYPYRLEDEWTEAYLAGDAKRIIRGGAWTSRSNSQSVLVMRLDIGPCARLNDTLGLRVASHSPLPGAGS